MKGLIISPFARLFRLTLGANWVPSLLSLVNGITGRFAGRLKREAGRESELSGFPGEAIADRVGGFAGWLHHDIEPVAVRNLAPLNAGL